MRNSHRSIAELQRNMPENISGDFKGIAGSFKPSGKFLRSPYAPLNIWLNDVVLDAGAHVGLFTRYAVARGAKQVIAIEPHPENIKALRKNTSKFPVQILEGAIIGSKSFRCGLIPLFISRSSNAHTLCHRIRASKLMVQSFGFEAVVEKYHPSIIKIDIEGSEYQLFPDGIPKMPSVRAMAIELDFKSETMQLAAIQLVEALGRAGWAPICKPTIKSTWCSVGIWRRA